MLSAERVVPVVGLLPFACYPVTYDHHRCVTLCYLFYRSGSYPYRVLFAVTSS